MSKARVPAPPSTRGKVDWPAMQETVFDGSGQWRYIPVNVTRGVAAALKRGEYTRYGFDPEKIEVTTRQQLEDGTAAPAGSCWVFIREA